MPSSRIQALHLWLNNQFSGENIQLTPLTGDAGFRRYYRFVIQGRSFIAVDAPKDKSNNAAFVFIQKSFSEHNVLVPEIIAADLSLGFLCLADLGETLLADILTPENIALTYQKAIDILPKIQSSIANNSEKVPHYDQAFVELELNIFSQWLLTEHLSIILSAEEQKQLTRCFSILTENMLSQPQVLVHRDYHSRNIMVLQDKTLGIIDFQDAVIGPITYDIVSLLRDCYLKWPSESVSLLLKRYIDVMTERYSLNDITRQQWQRWFDLTGLQRHIKASGIFARLHHRDNKSGYLKDIPLTLSYIVEISQQYPELASLHQLLLIKVLPAMTNLKKER
ncbi:aminoglycoside phosphotransferase family protein [Colwellia hornerae]|uniref:aminoglycoside phosphotransferase family protein n=1 Tax=Colwellia hornerae TaxID=89402 RepID=UPI0014791ACD|nr:phosphotransferase [Colwellia hornerae]